MGKSLTIITMMHNAGDREYIRRRANFLNSLDEQEILPERVIIVDTTTGQKRYTDSYQTDNGLPITITRRPRKVFNKSAALNIGLGLAKTEYVAFTDIDFLYHPLTIGAIEEMMSAERFLLARAFYLPHDAPLSHPFDWKAIMASSRRGELKESPGTIQCTTKAWFERVGGYDEKFAGGLGGMDDDMKSRANKDGLVITWLHKPRCFHQWHERSGMKGVCSHLFLPNPEVVK